ncbi:MAG: tRNA/rRNA methyltransferase [Rhodospirillaceae bacterium]|nr:MAG: tRNA/rRNA methyltransferase [Rhodospirillaceae bacterium]
MAGTDSTRPVLVAATAPVVILVQPRLAENVGTTARAMLNTGLTVLRLVAPYTSPLEPRALAAASGAESVLAAATVHASLPEAVADLHRLYAASARRRELVKPVLTPRRAALALQEAGRRGERCGLVFGPERTGLANDDIALADAIVEAPLNPAYASLNLAQAVLIVGYEWFLAGSEGGVEETLPTGDSRPATRTELFDFFRHLEDELDACGFLRVADKRPAMVRNIRTLFERASLTEQEVRTLHGIVKELRWGRVRPEGSLRREDDMEPEALGHWRRAQRSPRKMRGEK